MAKIFAVGYDSKDASTAPDVNDTVTMVAVGAIPVGSIVAASTTDAGGQSAVLCTAAMGTAQLSQGVYTGIGGTGAVATTTGLSGRAAVTGDTIKVVKNGIVAMRFAAAVLTSAVTFGTVKLSCHGTTAGWGQEATTDALVIGNLWQTLTGGGTTTGTEIVVTAKVRFR